MRSLPITPENAWSNQQANEINRNKVIAGRGLSANQTANGLVLNVVPTQYQNNLSWQGLWDTGSYKLNDVIVVTSSLSGSSTQTYICIKPVPPPYVNDTYWANVLQPMVTNLIIVPCQELIDTVRWNFLNYVPTSPAPTLTGISQSVPGTSYFLQQGTTFWQPIGGGGSSAVPLWKTFDLSASYNVGDEVVVDPYRNPPYSLPLVIYPNTSSVPMLTPGAYMCQVAVPKLTLMSSSISSSVTSSRNSWNCWYPHYPVEPSSSLKTVSGSLANQVVWYPIAPASLELQCIDGGVTYQWNCGYISQSFNLAQLPYKGP